jgi:hypothetical protein
MNRPGHNERIPLSNILILNLEWKRTYLAPFIMVMTRNKMVNPTLSFSRRAGGN